MRCQHGQNLPCDHKDPTQLRHRWKHRTSNNDLQRNTNTATGLLHTLLSKSRNTMVPRRRSHSLDRQQELTPDKKPQNKLYTSHRQQNRWPKLPFRPTLSSNIVTSPLPRMRPTPQEKYSCHQNDSEYARNCGTPQTLVSDR